MKLGISIPEEDVAFIDEYARKHETGSRSAVLRRALLLLRSSELADAYERASAEWSEDSETWESAVGDGLAR
ncbi:ribbon-helix-helix domain-containing protein [Nocardioidaceae bacterium SCSIO 66511]|nr:ribbon-helix-helix domain-containing protein [Nocardioidaceae bacterium SCSIO 66511]